MKTHNLDRLTYADIVTRTKALALCAIIVLLAILAGGCAIDQYKHTDPSGGITQISTARLLLNAKNADIKTTTNGITVKVGESTADTEIAKALAAYLINKK